MKQKAITTISVVNQKGGVGKTTLSILLGQALLERGYRVLFIDLDPSASLSNCLLSDYLLTNKNTVCHFLGGIVNVDETVVHSDEGFAIVRGDKKLKSLSTKLSVDNQVRTQVLKKRIAKLQEGFDFCIVDTSSSYDALLINALFAADLNVIPVNPEYSVFCGLQQIIDNISKISQKQNINYRILMNMHEEQIMVAGNISQIMRSQFGSKAFQNYISYINKIKIASNDQHHLLQSSSQIAMQVNAVCDELLKIVEQNTNQSEGRVVA